MARIAKLFKKAKKHFDEKGIYGGIKWLFFAVRFRFLMFVTRKTKRRVKEGNININKMPNGCVRKDMQNVFVFSMTPYYDIGGGQRPAQLARVFNSLGYKVHYIFGQEAGESVIYKMEIPTITHKHIEDYKEKDFTKHIQKDDLVIAEFAYEKFLPFLRLAKKNGAKIIYENIDNWETSLGEQFFRKKNLNEVLKMSDLLVGTADFLVQQLKGYCEELKIEKPIIYSPNAVNDILFNPQIEYEKPDDLVDGEKVLTYYGSLWGDWFDWDLLYGTAKAFPSYSFIMIGEKENIRNITNKAPKNIHFLGIKQQSDLPAYLQYSDYALIPFKVDKIGEAVSPLKIFEYISMNKIVLSTKMPEVLDYPNTLCGDTVEEWTKLLKKNVNVDVEARDAFVEQNNWTSRVFGILEALHMVPEKISEKISIVVLKHKQVKTKECKDSIVRHSKNYNYEIIEADDVFDEKVRKAKGEYLLFLHDNQLVDRDFWLLPFFDVVRKNEIDVVGTRAGWINKNKKITTDECPYLAMPANALFRTDVDFICDDGVLLQKKMFNELIQKDERDFAFLKDMGYKIAYSPFLGVRKVEMMRKTQGSVKKHNGLQEFVGKTKRKVARELRKVLNAGEIIKTKKKIANVAKRYDKIIVMDSVPWDMELRQRPHHLAEEFRKEGFLVLYLEYGNSQRSFREIKEGLLTINSEVYAEGIRKENKKLYFLTTNNMPARYKILKKMKDDGFEIVYDYLDEFHEDITEDLRIPLEVWNNLGKLKPVLCITTATKLYDGIKEHLGKNQKVVMAKNAVNVEHFDFEKNKTKNPPKDLKEIVKRNKPIIGFYGALAPWIDFELLNKIAKKHKEWEFVYLGINYNGAAKELVSADNVHNLGPKKYEDLAKYAKYFNVAIIPFKHGDIAKATSPVKLFEYMAAGLPTVCTRDLYECQGYDFVYISKDDDEFEKNIEKAIKVAKKEDNRKRLLEQAQENTWSSRVKAIVENLK